MDATDRWIDKREPRERHYSEVIISRSLHIFPFIRGSAKVTESLREAYTPRLLPGVDEPARSTGLFLSALNRVRRARNGERAVKIFFYASHSRHSCAYNFIALTAYRDSLPRGPGGRERGGNSGGTLATPSTGYRRHVRAVGKGPNLVRQTIPGPFVRRTHAPHICPVNAPRMRTENPRNRPRRRRRRRRPRGNSNNDINELLSRVSRVRLCPETRID